MKKETLVVIVSFALMISPLVGRSEPASTQQDPPAPDCCYQIYAAGSNLGWASSLLNYTYERTRLDPADAVIFENLTRAGGHVSAAHRSCSRMNPAWADALVKQRFLADQVDAIRRRPDPVIRRQVAGNVRSTYQWAQPLRVRMADERAYEHDTCAEKYFKLGFLLGYAKQSLSIAEEWYRDGRGEWNDPVNDAVAKLQMALQVLTEYFSLEGCTPIENLNLAARIKNVINADRRRISQLVPEMGSIWDSLLQRVTDICDLGTGSAAGRQPPRNNVTYFSNPAAQARVAPTAGGSEIVLRKELVGYAGYGTDGRADILYSGQVATWVFDLPPSLDARRVVSAFFRVSIVADDHYVTPLNQYGLEVWINGDPLGSNTANLPHGAPYGARFSNWVIRDYPSPTSVPRYSITLSNASRVSGWLAVDWIELHLFVR